MVVDHVPRIPAADLVGMVVASRAGRDEGDRYVVIAVSGDDMVLLADGRRRGAGRPKRKNVKHLVVHGPATGLIERLRAGGAVTDEELRDALSTTVEGE